MGLRFPSTRWKCGFHKCGFSFCKIDLCSSPLPEQYSKLSFKLESQEFQIHRNHSNIDKRRFDTTRWNCTLGRLGIEPTAVKQLAQMYIEPHVVFGTDIRIRLHRRMRTRSDIVHQRRQHTEEVVAISIRLGDGSSRRSPTILYFVDEICVAKEKVK